MTKIEDYANEIPKEIRRAIRGLDSDHRAGIFVALLEHGELSFTDLQRKLELDKSILTYHLRRLSECALIEHYYKHELGAEQYSYYSVTRFGQNFVETLSSFLRPEPYGFPIPKESSQTSHLIFDLSDDRFPKQKTLFIRYLLEAAMCREPKVLRRIQGILSTFTCDADTNYANTNIPEPITEREQVVPTQTV